MPNRSYALRGERRTCMVLTAIVIIAVFLRLLYSFVVYPAIADRYGWRITDGFEQRAKNLMVGFGYVTVPNGPPDVARPPVYPLFLVVIYTLFGQDDRAVQIIQSLLGGLTCIILYRLAREVMGKRVAVVTAFLFAIHLHSILYAARLFVESLYTLVFACFMFYLVRLFKNPRPVIALTSGGILGILTLTRANTLLLPIPIALGLLVAFWGRKKEAISGFTMLLIGMLTIIIPWTLRNYMVSKHFIPVATLGGQVLFVGNMAILDETGKWRSAVDDPKRLIAFFNDESFRLPKEHGIQDESERDSFLYKLTLDFALNHPDLVLRSFLIKAAYFWYLALDRSTMVISAIVNLPLVILGVIGLILAAIRKETNVLPYILVIGYMNIVFAIFWAQARYSIPIMPYIMMFTAYALLRIRVFNYVVNSILYGNKDARG